MTANLHRLVAAAVLFACLSSPAALVINEVCFDNKSLRDETNATPDWIELYNSGSTGVNINNYALGDSNPYDEAKGVRLPNYTIPPGGFLVVFASTNSEYTFWTNAPDVALVPANATWKYFSGSNAPPAAWNTNSFNDSSWAAGMAPLGYNDASLNLDIATVLSFGIDPANRYPTAYFRKTFNVINPSVVTELVVQARINDGAVVYLNGHELFRANMPAGAINHTTPASTSGTWWTTNLLPTTWLLRGANVLAVEVHQVYPSSVDLVMDLSLTTKINERVPIVHGQFALADEGENVHLFDPNLVRIHRLSSPGFELGPDRSYGLLPDGATNSMRVFEKPSPGLPNASFPRKYAQVLTAQKPSFSVAPGAYAFGQSVKLNTPTAGYRVYYTLDGSSPWTSTNYVASGGAVAVGPAVPVTSGLSWIRSAPVEVANQGYPVLQAAWQSPIGTVAKAVVLRAITVSGDNLYCSPETRGTYFIGPQYTNRALPIVSLTTDADNLFGFTNGIYIPGKYYADSPVGYGDNKWGKPYANYHQSGDDWERPIQFELFETNQPGAAFSQLLGVTVYGGATRVIPQKSLYFMARLGEYGVDRVNYPLFPGEAPTSYKRFLLHNSGNDWYGPDYFGVATMLKDAVFQRMVNSLDVSLMAYRPTIAYLNGEYWGIHNLRESLDKHYLATRYGLEPDNCDILTHQEDPDHNDQVKIERVDGDPKADGNYKGMLSWIRTNGLDTAANYARVQTWVDVTNYADYIIAETFFGNTDWPMSNCDFWRANTNQFATCGKYGDQRWRWMLYDLDLAGERGASFDMFAYLKDSRMRGEDQPGFLINRLWSNADFNRHFVTRYENLLNTTLRPERLAGIAAAAADQIGPEIETHFRRWGRTYTRQDWQQAVTKVLIHHTATRHEVSWAHLDSHFLLNGTGQLTVRNYDPSGSGGRFTVNEIVINTSTDGITNRAAWTGRFFRSLPIPVVAVPDAGYVFDGWVGSTNATPSREVIVGSMPLTFVARFRLATAPPHVVQGYEAWQLANYSEQQIVGGTVAEPGAPSGFAGMSNFELYAFGMHRQDGLTDAERLARVSLSISNQAGARWLGYTRLNDSFQDVRYTVKVARDLAAPGAWTDAVVGQELDGATIINVLDASTWVYQLRLREASPARDASFFRLEASPR